MGRLTMTKASDSTIEAFTQSHRDFQLAEAMGVKPLTRASRTALFFSILPDMPCASCGTQAKLFADTVLNTIEDVFSGAPYAPENHWEDGRLYPTLPDMQVKGELVDVCRHRAHQSSYGCNGAIQICAYARGQVVSTIVDKPGADGKTIGDLLGQGTQQLSGSGR